MLIRQISLKNQMKQIMLMMMHMLNKMKKSIIFLIFVFILISFSTVIFALKEGETEFFEFNDEQFALTAVNVNSDGTADVIISKHVPNFAKSLNVGESQAYFSNWQCFVTTLFGVDLDKSNVYIRS